MILKSVIQKIITQAVLPAPIFTRPLNIINGQNTQNLRSKRCSFVERYNEGRAGL